MFARLLDPVLNAELAHVPAVVLLGPRQSGKTTLALDIAERRPCIYLDLESAQDRARLQEPELYLPAHRDKLVILDEVHRAPGLFPILRGQVDAARRQGRRAGLFLLLGSASVDLLRSSGESLAGRVAYLELGPLGVLETRGEPVERLWLRGGFPESLLAPSDARSLRWRVDFIRTYVERDMAALGPRLPSETLHRLWTMLAHQQGGLFDASSLARALGMDARTVRSYVGLMEDLFLVRSLPPWHANVGKRLVKSPKVYVRDPGLVHALLAIPNRDALLAHPVAGSSWEGFVLEQAVLAARGGMTPAFYRTHAGAEVDLVMSWPGGELWAVEVKRSLAPRVERGFHQACEDLGPTRRLVVYPGEETLPLGGGLQAVSVTTFAEMVAARAPAVAG